MITGFNTDIEHDGVVYHVQTEDKGLESPIILSLVYAGGTILAAKRAPYKDLIAAGFSDEELSERLKRQHRLICAAIHSGRINDLKKMSGRQVEVQEAEVVRAAPVAEEFEIPAQNDEFEISSRDEFEIPAQSGEFEGTGRSEEFEGSGRSEEFEIDDAFEVEYLPGEASTPVVDVEVPATNYEPLEPVQTLVPDIAPVLDEVKVSSGKRKPAAYTVHDPRRQMPASEAASADDGLVITLLDDEQFYSGETRVLSVLVSNRAGEEEKPLGSVSVSIKILGTTFRPVLYSLKTRKDGVATVSTEIPEFTSGRAAVLIRASTKDHAAELRRVIHPVK